MHRTITPTELQKLTLMVTGNEPRQKLEFLLVSLWFSRKFDSLSLLVGNLFEIGSEQVTDGFKKRLKFLMGQQATGANIGMFNALVLHELVTEDKLTDEDILAAVRNYKTFACEPVVEKDSFTAHISQRFIDQVN